MSYCSKCGNQIQDNADYCPYCGNRVTHNYNQTAAGPSPIYYADTKRKKNKMLIPGIIAAFLIISLGSVFFFRNYAINKYYMYKSDNAATLENKIEFNIDAIKAKYTDASMENLKNMVLKNAGGDKDLTGYIDKLKPLVPQSEYKSMGTSYNTMRSEHYCKDKKYEDAFNCLIKAHNFGYTISSDKNYEGIMTNLAYKVSGCQEGLSRKQLNQAGIEYGDLDNDGVDEIVVLTKKMEDEYYGYQVVNLYKYTGHSYNLLDKLECNYIENVIDVFIAAANSKQRMIFLSGSAGAHAGYSIDYALQGGKLVPASQEPVYSLYPLESKDIDNDGYFEIPSESVDPESADQSYAGSDKIITWYKINDINNLVIAKQEYVPANH